jgi:multidrug efflux pump subunit AcrA (membrane-fusion protein)
MPLRRPTLARRRLVGVNAALALVLVAALAVAYVVLARPASSEPAMLRTVPVTRGNVTATVNATGNLTSTAVTTVTPGTSGTLTSLTVAAGDRVTKGQVLARLDPQPATQALATAQAQYDVAVAQYDETVAGQTSASRTKDQLAISSARLQVDAAQRAMKDATALSLAQAKQQLAGANLQLAQAQAQAQADAAGATAVQRAQASASVTSARASLQSAKDAVAATTVRAPASGTVLSVGAAVGDHVGASTGSSTGSGATGASGSASSSGTSGTSSGGFVVIADLASMQVTGQVAEADAAALHVGQSARITLPASGDTVDGTVTAVALQGTATNNVVQYPVTVRLSSVPDGVRLGASATVTITTASRDGVLTVPTSAITTTGTGATVILLRNGRQTTVAVTKGLSGGSTTEVSGDLVVGDQVVLPSGSRASTGVPGAGVARFGGFSGGVR